jgi:hypothetical protein
MESGVTVAGIVVAWVATFISGFIWFGPKTFFPTWWRLMGRTENDVPGGGGGMVTTFGSVLTGQLFAVATLAFIMGPVIELGRINSPIDGALFGLLVGTGIAGATALGHRMFSGHGAFVWLIESGNDIINLGLAGAILAALR